MNKGTKAREGRDEKGGEGKKRGKGKKDEKKGAYAMYAVRPNGSLV